MLGISIKQTWPKPMYAKPANQHGYPIVKFLYIVVNMCLRNPPETMSVCPYASVTAYSMYLWVFEVFDHGQRDLATDGFNF